MTDVPDQIGPYRVSREIGRGGMGVVYLARDQRLERDVAIKVLPEEMAADADRLARFEREGQSLAQLNHPNVAGIHGVEEQHGRKFLILEYVEGDTLADRLDAGPMPMDEALELAVGIASGLEAAHDVGVIHRDLKPDNVKITPDGSVKLLDFGLAKSTGTSTGTDTASAETVKTPRSPTTPGVILGTAAYMSPEQARGRSVDRRTDIWSFGVVLYEMLTGASPFVGETVSDSIGAILHKDVELERLPVNASPLLRRLLRRCLQRDRARRLRDIGDVRLELMAIAAGEDDRGLEAPSGGRPVRGIAVGVAAVVLAALLTGLGVWRTMQHEPPRVEHLALPQPPDMTWSGSTTSVSVAISRDGRSIAYDTWRLVAGRGESVIVLRHREQSEPITLTDLGPFVSEPFFSPDGQWIGYVTENELRAVSVAGGTPRRICDLRGLSGEPRGVVWRADGLVVIGTEGGSLYSVPAAGGTPEPLTTLAEGERSHSWPDTVPGTDL
ncbi:MAG: protein kinase domain-containing protein, partial [Planctomycetota bacterium]